MNRIAIAKSCSITINEWLENDGLHQYDLTTLPGIYHADSLSIAINRVVVCHETMF